MNRIAQGAALGIGLLASTACVAMLANIGAEKDHCAVAASISNIGCFLRNYKELAAGLLAADGAIFAAWMAWISVQNQLKHEEELATAGLRQTTDAIKVHLADHIDCINQVWRAIDFALIETDAGRQQEWVSHAEYMLSSLRSEGTPDVYMQQKIAISLDEIEELAARMIPPVPRYHLAAALGRLRVVYALGAVILERMASGTKEGLQDRLDTISFVRRELTAFSRFLSEFDPGLASPFAGRLKDYSDERASTAREWAELIDGTERRNAEFEEMRENINQISTAYRQAMEAREPKV